MIQQTDNPEKEPAYLDWPEENTGENRQCFHWNQPGSNICLDFHGDPANAELVVLSDGNHHMALRECLDLFLQQHKELSGIFYATTPPGPIVNLLKAGALQMGNLIIRVSPHVFISPPKVLDNLVAEGYMQTHKPFMRNRGSVLLVKKGNPKNISGVADLAQQNLRLFLSNPETETVSYRGYVDTLKGMAAGEGIELSFLTDAAGTGIVYGERIHHREVPQALADDRADVAIVYYHLALRYIRIFPALFEMIPLGGTTLDPQPAPENIISLTHAGIVGDGGRWGGDFLQFLSSKTVSDIYAYHGLLRAE
ncbi:MAG: substrate-binding domain-containing protein [Desulfobacterales bacterium]|nr:substrate-binding domain-containing protein [Desulfobacterales bacterium]